MAERPKQKRERKNYTEEEKAILLPVFWAAKKFPEPEECERLGHSMGRTRNQIQLFFDNQRKKLRREAKAAADAAPAEGPTEAQEAAAEGPNEAQVPQAAAGVTVPMVGPVVASSQQSNNNQQLAAVSGHPVANAVNGQASQQSHLYQQQATGGSINTVPGFYSPTNYVGVNGLQQQAPPQFAVDAARQYHQDSQLSANVVHFGNTPTVQIAPTVQMVANVPMSMASFNAAPSSNHSSHTPVRPGNSSISMPVASLNTPTVQMTPTVQLASTVQMDANVPMSMASFNSAPSSNAQFAHQPQTLARPGSINIGMAVASSKPEPYYESFLAAMLDDTWLEETKPVTQAWLEDMVINNPHAMRFPTQHIDSSLMDDNYKIAYLQ